MKPKEVLKKWVEYINAHEVDSITNLYHDDAVNLQVAVGNPLVGKTAIRNDFESFFKNIPDTTTKIINLFEDGDWAILEWTGEGTFLPTGKKYEFEGCGFFHVINGKIKFQRGYWDMQSWMNRIS